MSQWCASLIWPEVLQGGGSTEDYTAQPDFPDENWALWRNDVSEELDSRLRSTGCAAILAWAAWGETLMDDAVEPRWVSPDDLVVAVANLRRLLEDPKDAALILADYEDYGDRGAAKTTQFLEDLAVIEAKAEWARQRGKTLVTFDVNHSGSN